MTDEQIDAVVEAAVARAVLAERERIAREIEAWRDSEPALNAQDVAYDHAMTEAARIARRKA